MNQSILVVGGAGYIGSHMVKRLLDAGHDVVILDSLVTGHRDAVLGGEFIHGDLADRPLLDDLFRTHAIACVMHFASFIQVGESMQDPAKYYRNNVTNTQNLLDAMVAQGVRNFIFSSTAAIFGEPHYTPIDEAHPKKPINPYGRSKLMVEEMLADYDHAYGLKSVCLRYFNAAGAHPDGLLGERHDPETHLIPLVLQVASGRRESISVFGNDYPTQDGTCIRDYIHIMDLCEAHLLAMSALTAGSDSAAYNLGNGTGFSVNEIIESARRVTGKPIHVRNVPRREGDPAVLIADATNARQGLHWQPCHPGLDAIMAHAWQWEMHFTR
jgi:UDP-glucose 4-epimerase